MNVKTLSPSIIYYPWCLQLAVNLEDRRAFQNTFDLITHSAKYRRVHAKSVILQQKVPTEELFTGTTGQFNMK